MTPIFPLPKPPKRTPPVSCSQCGAAIAKYIEPGGEWHPCLACDGMKCEKCCDEAIERMEEAEEVSLAAKEGLPS